MEDKNQTDKQSSIFLLQYYSLSVDLNLYVEVAYLQKKYSHGQSYLLADVDKRYSLAENFQAQQLIAELF